MGSKSPNGQEMLCTAHGKDMHVLIKNIQQSWQSYGRRESNKSVLQQMDRPLTVWEWDSRVSRTLLKVSSFLLPQVHIVLQLVCHSWEPTFASRPHVSTPAGKQRKFHTRDQYQRTPKYYSFTTQISKSTVLTLHTNVHTQNNVKYALKFIHTHVHTRKHASTHTHTLSRSQGNLRGRCPSSGPVLPSASCHPPCVSDQECLPS